MCLPLIDSLDMVCYLPKFAKCPAAILVSTSMRDVLMPRYIVISTFLALWGLWWKGSDILINGVGVTKWNCLSFIYFMSVGSGLSFI